MDFLTSRAMNVTKLALDGLMMRQQAIASNTANVMTPDYQRKDIVFEDQLQKMLELDDTKREIKSINSAYYKQFNHMSLDTVTEAKQLKILTQNSFNSYKPEIILDNSMVNPETGNNVNLEAEMMDMAKTGIQYNILSTLEGKMFQGLSDVIKSGG